nr:hypothetical protein [Tanacetum cinerariifolium]
TKAAKYDLPEIKDMVPNLWSPIKVAYYKHALLVETVFKAGDTQGPQNLRENAGNTDEPPIVNVDPNDWFKKPERPPTPDPKWNEDFSTFVMNRLQISELTQDILVGPTYNILKGTCSIYVELGYNMKECYKALTYQLDWNNPEGCRYPFDLSKPLPLVMSGNRQIIP